MEFKVSKKKFIKNELLIIALILIILSIFFSKYSIPFFIIIFLWFFLYKEIKYYMDILYINEKHIRLKKNMRYGRLRAWKVVKEEYDVINLEHLEENLNQFVLYGIVEIKKTIWKNSIFSKYNNKEEHKTIKKLIIRKNFEKENEIRNLLKKANEKNSITNKEVVYYKYYIIKNKNSEEDFLFKIDKINNSWMFWDKNGNWKNCGNLDNAFENKKEMMYEITQNEAINIQNKLK